MLDTLRQFISGLVSETEKKRFADNDYRVAAAALLVHIQSLDGPPSEIERARLRQVLASRFDLDDAAVDELIATATMIEGESVDLYQFTSLIMRAVDKAGRLRIVEMMWEIVLADGRISEFEDNVVWRSADLLGISSRERIALRARVAGSDEPLDTAQGSDD